MTGGEITFVTFDHAPHKILTSEQMRRTEADAIEAGFVTGLSMMECAGNGVVEALLQAEPRFAEKPQKALVLCGPGNNGGDGFVIARLLKRRGWTVQVFLLGQLARLPVDAAHNAQRWLETGDVSPIEELIESDVAGADIAFDALFGTGLMRPLAKNLVEKLDIVAAHIDTIVAVDIPSGINADSGKLLLDRAPGESTSAMWPRADHIVTFQRMKPGHLFSHTKLNSKSLSIIDLGIAGYEPHDEGLHTLGNGAEFLREFDKLNHGHKYQHGHAFVLAGGPGKGGAGRLAARAALRIGAGLVTLGCAPKAIPENAAQLTAIMLSEVDDAARYGKILEDTRINALCLGPGLGAHGEQADNTRALVTTALTSRRACVLDADALTVFQAAPEALFAMLHDQVVLTPHFGEFSRLFPDIAAKLSDTYEKTDAASYSMIDAVKEASKRAQCCVLLKGLVTVIASSDGSVELSCAIGARAVPWLSTAGAGDVLAGIICGLLARGFTPLAACKAGAWLHVECARNFGPGLIAEDLSEQIPAVLRRLSNANQ